MRGKERSREAIRILVTLAYASGFQNLLLLLRKRVGVGWEYDYLDLPLPLFLPFKVLIKAVFSCSYCSQR